MSNRERPRSSHGRKETDKMVRYPHLYGALTDTIDEIDPRWEEEQIYDEARGPRDRTHRPSRWGLHIGEAAAIQAKVLAEMRRS